MADAFRQASMLQGGARIDPRAEKGMSPWLRILPIALLTSSYLLFPPEVRLNAGGLNLPVYRLLVILMIPLILIRSSKGLLKFALADLCVLVSALWMIISFVAYYGLEGGFVRSIALVIDLAGSYFLARVSINSPNDMRRLLVVLSPAFVISGLELLIESVNRQLLVRPFFAAIFGNLNAYSGGEVVGSLNLRQDLRLGLLRAFGSFSHPILAGVVLTSTLALYSTARLKSWPKWSGLASAFMGLFSLSSSAILAVGLIIALLCADFVKKRLPNISWWVITAFICLILFFLQVASKNGVVSVLIRMTLDPQTGFYRLIIWEYGWKSIMNHPFIGIGFTPYERAPFLSTSIDAHFLLLGVRHGIVVPLALVVGVCGTLVALGKNMRAQSSLDRDFMLGLNVSLLTLLITSMTVTFFSEANIWFMSILAFAASLSVYDCGDHQA